MPDQTNSSLGLFKGNIADQRLILPIRRFHLSEQHLGQDWPKVFQAEENRTANVSVHNALCRRFYFHRIEQGQLP